MKKIIILFLTMSVFSIFSFGFEFNYERDYYSSNDVNTQILDNISGNLLLEIESKTYNGEATLEIIDNDNNTLINFSTSKDFSVFKKQIKFDKNKTYKIMLVFKNYSGNFSYKLK